MDTRHRRGDLFRPIVSPGVLGGPHDPLRVLLWRIGEACRRSHRHARVLEFLAQVLVYSEWLKVVAVNE